MFTGAGKLPPNGFVEEKKILLLLENNAKEIGKGALQPTTEPTSSAKKMEQKHLIHPRPINRLQRRRQCMMMMIDDNLIQ